ncbi:MULTISPECIES: hypothetical protein [Streptomyces]|uniref:Uncharacterized protein n=1 Tax=Streptomyces viridochromogenes TaxID=1938 RepID=A0A0L8JD87_STRVR|nr:MULTISPECIES: hypothetical protein [Streptomyces]KOG11615.1 hypothetical protein ADK34_33950 [Streptomyces viridochromogenes]
MADRHLDVVLTPDQALRITPIVDGIVAGLNRRLDDHRCQLSGNGEGAEITRAREEGGRDPRRSLLDEERPVGSVTAESDGVLGRDHGPATVLSGVGFGGGPATAAELQQGALPPSGQQPSTAPFGLPGGPTVGVAGVTAGAGLGGMGMGMGMGGGASGGSRGGRSASGTLGKADPDVWGAGARDTWEHGRDRGEGTTLASGETRGRARGGSTGSGGSGGGGPPGAVLGRR